MTLSNTSRNFRSPISLSEIVSHGNPLKHFFSLGRPIDIVPYKKRLFRKRLTILTRPPVTDIFTFYTHENRGFMSHESIQVF